MAKKLLITGSEGLIGRILWRNLGNEYDLYGLDRAEGAAAKKLQADITNLDGLNTVFDRIGPLDYVVHLAGDSGVDASWESALNNNIHGTRNLYEAARAHGVKRIIFASSNHATGAYVGFPNEPRPPSGDLMIRPSDPVRPDGFYGVSKVAGEAIARLYFDLYGLESICLRIGSVVPGDDPTGNPMKERMWLSYRDMVQLVRRSLVADVPFGIYYGISNNQGRFLDISAVERDLGYKPEDDSSRLKKA